MFDTLSTRLGQVFDRLRGRGALSENDVNEALREVRVALLEADVALPVVRDFIEKVRVKAVGQDVLRSVTPGQQVVKIVHDELTAVLGEKANGLDLEAAPPVVIMMVGLQGSGKTTSTAKIARRLTQRDRKKVLMASLDVQRPAAQEQLRVLGEQAGVATLPVIAGQMPVDIAKRAVTSGRLSGYDVILLDTAGRLHIDEQLMAEVAAVRDIARPHETLLVADALTGQDAVNIAKTFKERVGITGLVLTRMDGDARGGAALSMRAITGAPIKLIGMGEKLDALEDFHPERVAGRILGMGDVVSLVEKAAETLDAEKAQEMAKRMEQGSFTLDDLSEQLKQMQKIGGMKGVLGMLPGVGKIKNAIEQSGLDEKMFVRQQAMISSMTRKERAKPEIINGSRRKRIAKGSGVDVSELNKLLKMHRQMADMMKELKKGKKGGLAGMAQMFGLGGGGMPQLPPGGLPGLPPGFGRK
ncbi:MAG: signal recognition particle protein [Alphaproteobacteria bacterium]|nr:signal recognition particle protein [Alphaproteobacteria bacterium]